MKYVHCILLIVLSIASLGCGRAESESSDIDSDSTEVVDILGAIANFEYTPDQQLVIAAFQLNVDRVKALLEDGADGSIERRGESQRHRQGAC